MKKLKVRDIEVTTRIGEAKDFRIYLGEDGHGEQVLLKVAKTFESGDILIDEAKKLRTMKSLTEEIARIQKKAGETDARYDLLFVHPVISYLESSHDDRRINVYKVVETEFGKLTPLAKLRKDTEIDARTSVWILGRLLKFYNLFEIHVDMFDLVAADYPVFSPDSYLIGPERHRLIYYNYAGELKDVIAYDFVKAVAKFMFGWTVIEDDKDRVYLEFVKDLAENGRRKFEDAHAELYEVVDELWGRKYHPFTYREKGTITWKTIKEG